MNYQTTEIILDALQPVCDLNNISISTENKDWRGRAYKSDFITIIKNHNIGFEVFDNAIIAFYFTDHYHIEDYSMPTENGEDYVTRAIVFLTKLFTLPVRNIKVCKGEKVKREEYFFVNQNREIESLSGPTVYFLCGNPFVRETTTKITWQYDKEARDFIVI